MFGYIGGGAETGTGAGAEAGAVVGDGKKGGGAREAAGLSCTGPRLTSNGTTGGLVFTAIDGWDAKEELRSTLEFD